MTRFAAPIVMTFDGINVVRDDVLKGGTKARYIWEAFDGHGVVVYASPCEGGAQVALAVTAKDLGKRAVIVCAARKERHPRTIEAQALGAEIVEIGGMAMLTVVQARARELAQRNGWKLAPFGLETPHAVDTIRDAALRTDTADPDEIWCAASSGVLARGLARAWPNAERHVVQVGHRVRPDTVAGATIHVFPHPLRYALLHAAPFPSDPHYDSKAWTLCADARRAAERPPRRNVLFWNVFGDAR